MRWRRIKVRKSAIFATDEIKKFLRAAPDIVRPEKMSVAPTAAQTARTPYGLYKLFSDGRELISHGASISLASTCASEVDAGGLSSK